MHIYRYFVMRPGKTMSRFPGRNS